MDPSKPYVNWRSLEATKGKIQTTAFTPLKFNSKRPLKMDGWKTTFLLGWRIFKGYVKLPWSNSINHHRLKSNLQVNMTVNCSTHVMCHVFHAFHFKHRLLSATSKLRFGRCLAKPARSGSISTVLKRILDSRCSCETTSKSRNYCVLTLLIYRFPEMMTHLDS